jgi:hypothetical protein
MTVGSGDLDSRQDEKIIHWQPVQPHQTFLEHVIHSVARVVIGDSEAVQTLRARSRDQVFRAGNTVSGKKRMRVQVDIKGHGEKLWPLLSWPLHKFFN